MIDAVAVKIAIESIPDGRDEITRPGLGRRVVAQGELDACDGTGGMLCQSAQPLEYRCITPWEKLVFGSAQAWIERDVLSSDGVHRLWWRRMRALPARLRRAIIRISFCRQVCAMETVTALQA